MSHKQLSLAINDTASQAFFDGLPYYPRCSDDVKSHGLVTRPRELAALHRQIQYNPHSICRALVFDIDQEGLGPVHFFSPHYWWQDMDAPPPNWILTNPDTGNCHYIYMLAAPVPLTEL